MKDQVLQLAAAVDKSLSTIEDITNVVAKVLLDGTAEDLVVDGTAEDLVASGTRFISSEIDYSPHEENVKDVAFKSALHSILKCHAQAAPLIDFVSTFKYEESVVTEAFTSGSLRLLRILVTNVTLELSKAQVLLNGYKELVDPSDVQNTQSLLQSMVDGINTVITAINTAITCHNDFFNNEVFYHVDKVSRLSFV